MVKCTPERGQRSFSVADERRTIVINDDNTFNTLKLQQT